MPRRSKLAPHGGFYEDLLDDTRRKAIRAARAVEGLDEDIALLRASVRAALSEAVIDHNHVLRTMAIIIKAELVRERLSSRSGNDLRNSVAGVLRDVGDLLDGQNQTVG